MPAVAGCGSWFWGGSSLIVLVWQNSVSLCRRDSERLGRRPQRWPVGAIPLGSAGKRLWRCVGHVCAVGAHSGFRGQGHVSGARKVAQCFISQVGHGMRVGAGGSVEGPRLSGGTKKLTRCTFTAKSLTVALYIVVSNSNTFPLFSFREFIQMHEVPFPK